MPPDGERLAALESSVSDMRSDVSEIKGDVKILLGAFHAANGASRLLGRAAPWVGMLVSGLLSIAAVLKAS